MPINNSNPQYQPMYTGQPTYNGYQYLQSPTYTPYNAQYTQYPQYNTLPQSNIQNGQYQMNQRQQVQYPQGITWVSESEATGYNPPSGAVTALWLKERNEIYLKSLDEMGKPCTRILEYREKPQNQPVDVSDQPGYTDTTYALKSDVERVQREMEALRKDIEPLRSLTQDTTRKRRAKSDEE